MLFRSKELAALRRDKDRIEAGGVAHDDLAVTAALAVECWTESVVPEIAEYIPRVEPLPNAPRDSTERLVRSFMVRVSRPAEAPLPRYGVRTPGPGR